VKLIIKNIYRPMLVLLFLLLYSECSRTTVFSNKGWSIVADSSNEHLIVKQKDIGIVLQDVTLNLEKNNSLTPLSGWTIKKKDSQKLIIKTEKPQVTTWEFIITDEGININSSTENVIVKGVAPASGGRIPARVASQDNGVIYTSLGFVSAKNIYCLFDRKTDTMIQFPEKSDLQRNASDEQLMDVVFPLRDSLGDEGRTRRGVKIIPSAEISLIQNYYTDELGLKHYEPYWPQNEGAHKFKTAPTGWLSWYCYYMPANQEDMVKDTDALAEDLKKYGLEYVQLDATFTRGKNSNWLEWDKEKYPKGGKWLMQYVKSKGLKPGLWVNIYGANYDHPAFGDQFPDGKYPENWFLHDKNGNLIGACCTADSTVVKLDYSNPQVIKKHLIPLFKTLVNDWGIEYLKDAGHAEWQWTYEENRSRVYNPSLEGRDLYWEAQKAVRNIMGPENWIMGCDAEGGADFYSLGFGLFDSAFNILDDVYNVWEQYIWAPAMGTKMHLASMFSANYLNDIVFYNDPDATMIRPPLTMDEAINNVTSISLTGQSYMISDFMSQPSEKRIEVLKKNMLWGKEFPELIKKLSSDRLKLYKKTMPAMNITPIDLYPFRAKAEYAPLPESYPKTDNFPRALDLKVNKESGVYDVVAVYNWSDKESYEKIGFKKDLGLDNKKSYLIFDFWNKKLIGIVRNEFQVLVAPHGTRVLIIRASDGRPQLLTSSRHITSSYSIKALSWDPDGNILSGTSKVVPDDSYSIFIYVPKSIVLSNIKTNAVTISNNMNSNRVLKLNLRSKNEIVKWALKFNKIDK